MSFSAETLSATNVQFSWELASRDSQPGAHSPDSTTTTQEPVATHESTTTTDPCPYGGVPVAGVPGACVDEHADVIDRQSSPTTITKNEAVPTTLPHINRAVPHKSGATLATPHSPELPATGQNIEPILGLIMGAAALGAVMLRLGRARNT